MFTDYSSEDHNEENVMTLAQKAVFPILLLTQVSMGCHREEQFVQRPETIVSLREVMYDSETYIKLASLWKQYNEVYPSEEAYANWMYAARYAADPDYTKLLESGLRQYPGNPKLLYLKSLVHHGKPENLEALTLLERAVELDPKYTDPWFALVVNYIERGEEEKVNVALRKILDAGVVAEEVMDFSYNMLSGLEKDAILVTNGDNDTYPGWILTRVVGYRPDVRLVNVSLLNTDWYPRSVQANGVPHFLSVVEQDSLKSAYYRGIQGTGDSTLTRAPYSDLLLGRLVAACANAGRPVYFAPTVERSAAVKRFVTAGRVLGLTTLVTQSRDSYRGQLRSAVNAWLREFRTGGLDSWGLRFAGPTRAGKVLVANYAAALHSQMGEIGQLDRETRRELFHWYRDHLRAVLLASKRDNTDPLWCRFTDIDEIRAWCQSQNLSK
jgi:tetratricopeptide (TPR) repeat protein